MQWVPFTICIIPRCKVRHSAVYATYHKRWKNVQSFAFAAVEANNATWRVCICAFCRNLMSSTWTCSEILSCLLSFVHVATLFLLLHSFAWLILMSFMFWRGLFCLTPSALLTCRHSGMLRPLGCGCRALWEGLINATAWKKFGKTDSEIWKCRKSVVTLHSQMRRDSSVG